VKYWDTQAQTRRKGTHLTSDEFQYGEHPTNRSPASKHIIELVTKSPQTERITDRLLQKPTIIIADTPTPSTTDATTTLMHDILQQSPLPRMAAAAKLSVHKLARSDFSTLVREIQHLQISHNMCDPEVTETIPLRSQHSLLGLVLCDDDQYSHTVVFKECIPGSVADKHIRCWRSRLRGSIL
jgi:hypothetical protein